MKDTVEGVLVLAGGKLPPASTGPPGIGIMRTC
jgi:hypothetical protein